MHCRFLSCFLLAAAVLLLLPASCTYRGSRVQPVLAAADSLMMSRPEAALDTLLTLDSTVAASLRGRERADYTLLMTEARYKCWLPVAEDTAITKAAGYYRRKGPDSRLARALMMQGAVYQEGGDPVQALVSYKEAEPVMESSGDYEQLGLLNTRIGELYQKTFTDGPSMVYRYRRAVACFEKGETYGRLPSAYLSLARVLLPDKDSLQVWENYYAKGLEYAIACKDTARLVEAMDQKATYLRLYKEDYAEAARVSLEALEKYRKYLTLNYYTDFNFIVSESYLKMGLTDSARVYADRIPESDAVSRMIRDRLNSQISGSAGEWESAYGYSMSSRTIQDSLRGSGEGLMLSGQERSIDDQRTQLAHKKEKRNLKAVIVTVVALAVAVCILTVSIAVRLRVLRSKIRKAMDGINVPVEGNENDAENINILSSYVKEYFNSLQERENASSEVSSVMKTQLSILDEILENYYVYGSAESRLSFRISEVIERRLRRSKAKEAIMRATSVLYPGFPEYLQYKYGFTETDLFYTSLLLCGFNNGSQQVITGNKMTSISVARSKAAAKTGKNCRLTTFLMEELEVFKADRSYRQAGQ